MLVTQELMHEHRVIEAVLGCLQRATEEVANSGSVDSESIRACLDFFRNFADGCHHHKEESCLFPRLEAAGIPREGGPIGVMLTEHEEGRARIGEIEAALDRFEGGDVIATNDIVGSSQAYIALLEDHIEKEDHVLFPLAEEQLSAEDKEATLRDYETTADSDVGSSEHSRLLETAQKLCQRWDIDYPAEESAALGA